MFSGSSEVIGNRSYPVVINDGTGDKFLPVVEVIDVITSTTSETEDTGIKGILCDINKIYMYI